MYAFEDDYSEFTTQNYRSPVPQTTYFITKCKKCGLSLNYLPEIKRYFLNSWEISLGMPILVLTIIISSYLVFIFFQYKLLGIFSYYEYLYLTILMILYIFSYISCILEGPGYLPFYYPIRPFSSIKENDPFDLSGVVTNSNQLDYAKSAPAIPRSYFFKSARRVVIRPDHFCGWVQSFIGKKNHKLFFHFNMWGSIYCISFFVTSLRSIITLFSDDTNSANFPIVALIFNILYTIMALSFIILQSNFVVSMICLFFRNKTQFEDWKTVSHSPIKYGCDGWVDVCGPTRKWYTWILPFSPFHGQDPASLLEDNAGNKLL